MSKALKDIENERHRQIDDEHWMPSHDDAHDEGELADFAAMYAMTDLARVRCGAKQNLLPFDERWWKPTPEDRRRELVKAGALIVAEIERIDRSKESP